MNRKITLKISKSSLYILLGLYILAALYLLYISPFCGRASNHRSLQLIPFKTIIEQLSLSRGLDYMLGNMVGNVFVLLPAGFYLALLGWTPTRGKALGAFMAAAFFVELLQYLLWVGCMDIDDIWMNGAGGLLGFWMGRRLL